MAEENRADAAADDLRRRQEEAGGVVVDGPAGGVETAAPVEPSIGRETAATSIAPSDQPAIAQPAGASAATPKPKAVPVTELALTHPAQMQAKADAEKAASAANAMDAARHADLERDLRKISETDYERAVVDAMTRLAQDTGRANYITRAAAGRKISVRELAPDFVGAVPNREEAIAAEKQQRHLRHQADLEAESRMLGEAVGDTEMGIYVGPTEEGKQALKDHRFNKLPFWRIPVNEADRWWQQQKIVSAIYRAEEAPQTAAEIHADIAAAEARAKQSRFLTKTDQNILANKDRLLRIADTMEDRAFQDMREAHARYLQIPESPALRKFAAAKTAGEKAEVLLDNLPEFLAVKAGQAIPVTASRTIGRALTGPLGGAFAATLMAFGTKYTEAVMKGFADRGIDLQNEAAVRDAIADKKLMREIYNNAFLRAGIAATDQAAAEFLRIKGRDVIFGR